MLLRLSLPLLMVAASACVSINTDISFTDDVLEVSDKNVQVMVLGTYHMAGSSSDVINLETDSVLTPERQRELQALTDALAAFKPTVVLTERETLAPDYIDSTFERFSEAMLAEKENERVQVAYRLANYVGISRVYGIDEQPTEGEPDYFPFEEVMAHAEATGQKEKFDGFLSGMRTLVTDFSVDTNNLSIAAKLLEVNTGPLSAPDFYYALSEFDTGEDQPGAELQAYWFMRNAKIWSKLMDVTNPGDRVVVVYGAGHKYWLEHMADHTDGYVKVDPAPYLEAAASH